MDKKALLIFAVTLIFLAIGTDAKAVDFLKNYSDWNKLSENNKLYYVMGAVAGSTQVMTLNKSSDNFFRVGVSNCLIELEATNTMISEAVSSAYERNLDKWDRSPANMVRGVLHHTCLKQINLQLERAGLPLFKPWNTWK